MKATLLNLPAELRNRIYALAYKSSKVITVCKSESSGSSVHYLARGERRCSTNILLINRKIYKEVLSLFYNTTVFHFTTINAARYFFRSPQHLPWLKNVHHAKFGHELIASRNRNNEGSRAAQLETHLGFDRICLNFARSLPSLVSLKLSLLIQLQCRTSRVNQHHRYSVALRYQRSSRRHVDAGSSLTCETS